MLKYCKLSHGVNLNIGKLMNYREKTKTNGVALAAYRALPALLTLSLSACSVNPAHVIHFKPPAPSVAPVASDCQSSLLADALRHSGAAITRVGDMTQIDFLSNQIFLAQTANTKPGFYPMVSKLKRYISCFTVRDVTINAYEAPRLSASKMQALTSQRAQRLGNAMLDTGLNVRVLTSIGNGDNDRIALNKTWQGRLTNNRMTIRFWRISPRVGLL